MDRQLTIQKIQLKSILSDHTKQKQKCFQLSQQLHQNFEKIDVYNKLQKQIKVKVDLVSLEDLKLMKSKLLKSLEELFELESELSTKKELIEARRKSYNEGYQKMGEFRGSPSKKQTHHQQQYHNFNVPVYKIKDDTPQNKVQRISKYVASLKRNMKQHCSIQNPMNPSNPSSPQNSFKQIILHDQQFLKMKEQLQRYKMKEEQLPNIIQRKVREAINEQLKGSSVVEETKSYKIVKMMKETYYQHHTDISGQCSSQNSSTNPKISNMQHGKIGEVKNLQSSDSNNNSDNNNNNNNNNLQCSQQQFQQQKIYEFEQQLDAKNKNQYNQLTNKIGKTMYENQEKLKQLREERKKIFLDDDDDEEVWKQFSQY